MDFNISDLETKAPEVVEKPSNAVDELASFLGEYKTVETPTPEVSNNPITSNPIQSTAPPLTPNQVGQWGYYKSGPKAGQPRPQPKKAVTYTPAQTQTTLNGSILTGALFITMMDFILPLVIVALNNKFSDHKITQKDLALKAEQKKELAPVADQVLRQFDFNANPTAVLIFSTIAIYGANYAMIKFIGEQPKKNDVQQTTMNNDRR